MDERAEKAGRTTVERTSDREMVVTRTFDAPARFVFADTLADFRAAALLMGYPCVVKPVMSSSGKGQSVVRSADDLASAWGRSQTAGRAGAGRVIVEEFITFESEVTLLTVRSIAGTAFCDPIGHLQVDGDYVESWQPHVLSLEQLAAAQAMARAVTDRLGGYGLYGVELFLLADGRVIFSEVSPSRTIPGS